LITPPSETGGTSIGSAGLPGLMSENQCSTFFLASAVLMSPAMTRLAFCGA
jgi:hypothetical protein